MWTIVIAILIGTIVGSCIFGKKFWENRLTVLGLIAILMLVGMVTASYIIRPTLTYSDKVIYSYTVRPMWLSPSLITKEGYVRVNDSSFSMSNADADNLVARRIVNDTVKQDSGYVVKRKFAKEVRRNYLIYGYGDDMRIGLIKITSNNDITTDYWTIDEDLKIIPVPNGTKARVEQISIYYSPNRKWIISDVIPCNASSYVCLYLPQFEYDKLPDTIKNMCYLNGRSEFLKQLAAK